MDDGVLTVFLAGTSPAKTTFTHYWMSNWFCIGVSHVGVPSDPGSRCQSQATQADP